MENVGMANIEDDFNGELENYVSVSMGFCLIPVSRPDVPIRG